MTRGLILLAGFFTSGVAMAADIGIVRAGGQVTGCIYSTFAGAVAAANPNDTIFIKEGTTHLIASEVVISESIKVFSSAANSNCSVAGTARAELSGSLSSPTRLLTVDGGSNVEFRRIILLGGSVDGGNGGLLQIEDASGDSCVTAVSPPDAGRSRRRSRARGRA